MFTRVFSKAMLCAAFVSAMGCSAHTESADDTESEIREPAKGGTDICILGDASPPPVPDSGKGQALACTELGPALVSYAQKHKTCAASSDCAVVGGAGTCNCARYLGAPSGVALRRDALGGVAGILDRFASQECQTGAGVAVCDAAPGIAVCDEGTCVVRVEQGCNMPPPRDAGPVEDPAYDAGPKTGKKTKAEAGTTEVSTP